MPTLTVTDDTFVTQIESSPGLVLVDFWAPWCAPCRSIAPMLELLAEEYKDKAKISKIDVDANPDVARRFQVRSIPALLFFKDGKVVDQLIGAVPKSQIVAKLNQHS